MSGRESPSIDAFVGRMRAAGVALPSALVGCTEQEIASIEAELGLLLPDLYRSALLTFGRSAGALVDAAEVDFYFEAIAALNRRVRAGGVDARLPPGAFVVRGRHDEQFEFLLPDGSSADRPVHYVSDGSPAPVVCHRSIIDWLDAVLRDALTFD